MKFINSKMLQQDISDDDEKIALGKKEIFSALNKKFSIIFEYAHVLWA